MSVDYLIISLATLLAVWIWKRSPTGRRYPPGPLKLPIIGHALSIPINNPWFKFTEWKARYGDIIYLEALGQRVLVLNSMEVIQDLMERKGRVTSGRPIFTMIGELMGLDKALPLRQSDSTWKYQRKLCHNLLTSDSVRDYLPVQRRIISLFLRDVVVEKKNFIKELRLAAGRIIMSVTYGLPFDMDAHMYIADAEKTLELAGGGVTPGAYLVDLIPILGRLPTWIPFNSIPKVASDGTKLIMKMVEPPFEYVKLSISQGTAALSFTRTWLEEARMANSDEEVAKNEENVMWLSGAMFAAGSETTYSSVLWFILAMALNPDVQTKLQKELDSVIGPQKLFPSLEDRKSLPYVNATIKEVLRWRPPLPMAIAHKLNVDEIYRDYFIPKDTIVIPNVWAISRDSRSGFPAEEFHPERFLDESLPDKPLDPYSYTFGFGRRVCPGKHLGDNSVFLFITGLMATTTISRHVDAEGNPLPLKPKLCKGALNSYPEDFSVVFTPRKLSHERINGHILSTIAQDN